MSRLLDDDAKAGLLQRAREAGASGRHAPSSQQEAQAQADFLARYYGHLPVEDLWHLHPLDIMGAAMSHWQLAQDRRPGQASVRVFSPTVEQQGWASTHSVIEIVTDDMPFLVDSVTAELNRQEREIHLIVHPILAVVRDASGRRLRLCNHPAAAPASANLAGSGSSAVGASAAGDDEVVVLESWMHVEIDRETDPADLEALERALQGVLSDVRESTRDEAQMRERALELAEVLRAKTPYVPEAERTDAVELLGWLAEENFTFLGYQEYAFEAAPSSTERWTTSAVPGSALGVLRSGALHGQEGQVDALGQLPDTVPAGAREKLLILTKAGSRSTVHRNTYLDYVGVKRYDAEGHVVGEHGFLGLFTSAAYTDRVRRVPLIRRKVEEVLRRSEFPPNSHSGRDLLSILETFPRDELFQAPVDHIERVALGVLFGQERRRVRVFARGDEYDRFVSVLVYLPRDRFNTGIRMRMQEILSAAYGSLTVDFRVSLSESVLARLHFVVRMPAGRIPPLIDTVELETQIAAATRSWTDDFAEALVGQAGEEEAARLVAAYPDPFPEAYKEDFDARTGVADLRRILDLNPDGALSMSLYTPPGAAEGERRFKVFCSTSMSLAEVLPILQRMGVEVVDERPYEIRQIDGVVAHLYDFGLRYTPTGEPASTDAHQRFQDTFAAVWRGAAENDGFNGLVLRAGLTWRQAALLRAYGKYLRQAGTPFSQDYLESALVNNPGIARLLCELFQTRFDPTPKQLREPAAAGLAAEISNDLNSVVSLDQDRILRSYLHLIRATLRTNYFQSGANGEPKTYLSFKLDPQAVPDLPLPRPRFEIWVYSPRVEGVHLRFGPVARGGLRWSDRREDFRTEVLGLVKAQMVKNAVIVPTGAKGGFVVKSELDGPGLTPSRDEILAEAVGCYQTFIRAMLDITDNLVTVDGRSEVAPPPGVVRHDGDDPYLVVAADKGTASFSDYANAVAAEYGFWLGDAFASGGSAGYDHKDMGITARGAWESVRRHFRELGHDVQAQDFTVVGIGDMSGDVFGNGMLLSEHIRLIAAFDHRHIFLDPNPDAAASFAERRRLYDTPRSSWADYSTELISSGGGVYPRSAKTIQITPEVSGSLGLEPGVTSLAPSDLLQAILRAPVDLLWNGGIGTYVKAAPESAADVGDKANDPLRVNGRELRCRVVGEGGNLGFTQLGRVEYALTGGGGTGGRINTDAIDNSAGVDTSDHEVNLKVLLNRLVADGDLTEKHRNALLAEVTDDVAQLVLEDNYEQNVVLGVARAQSASMLSVHRRMLSALEASGKLDRSLEFLPSDAILEERAATGGAMTSPELAVLLAYAKITLQRDVLASDLPEEPWYAGVLRAYFPQPVVDRYADRLAEHRLRRDIIGTGVVNDLVNRGGMTFVFRAIEETGAAAPEVIRAYTIVSQVYGFSSFWKAIEALDGQAPTASQTQLYLEGRRMLDRGVRWLLHSRSTAIDVAAEIEHFGPPLAALAPRVAEFQAGVERERTLARAAELEGMGIPGDLALRGASLLGGFSLLDIVEISASTERPAEEVAAVYYALSDRFSVDTLLSRITRLPRGNRWHNLARSALRYDLYSALAALTADVVLTTELGEPAQRIAAWEKFNAEGLARAENTLREVTVEAPDLAVLSVALRSIRTLLRTT